MSKTVTPFHWKDKLTNAIGRIIVSFSQFEDILEFVIGLIMGIDIHSKNGRETILAVTAQLQTKPKLELFRKLVNIHVNDEQERQHLFDIANRAEELNKDRTDIVHASWIGFLNSEDEFSSIRYKKREKLVPTHRNFSAEELDNIHIRLIKLVSDLNQYAAQRVQNAEQAP